MFYFQGKIEIQGHPTELVKRGIDFEYLVSDKTNDELESVSVKNGTSRANSNLSKTTLKSKEAHNDKTKTEPLQQLELSSKGKVEGSVFAMYLRSGANLFVLFVIMLSFLLTQLMGSGADYWVSYW